MKQGQTLDYKVEALKLELWGFIESLLLEKEWQDQGQVCNNDMIILE